MNKKFLCAVLSSVVAGMPLGESYAGPLRNAVEKVGGAVGDTVEAVGDTVKDAADTVSGNSNPAETRKEIDKTAAATLKAITSQSKAARMLAEAAYGYAVFDCRKASLLLTTGKGIGVAIRKNSGHRVYMHVATAGVNVGAGLQYYQSLFLFENKASFDSFVERGWQADAGASATLGKASLDAQAKFTNGMAYYQISDAGIMLNADITGTKYWKSAELNGTK